MKSTDKNSKPTLSKWDITSLTTGMSIGVGIIMFVGVAMVFAGSATWLAYLISCVLGFILILPITLYSSAVKINGSYYSICSTLWNDRAAGYYITMSFFSLIGMANVGLTLGIYVNQLVPSMSINMIAIIAFTLFYILNLAGVDVMAKVQNVGMVFLIGGLALFIILGIPNVNWSQLSFSSPDFMFSPIPGTSGINGLMFAISILTFLTISVNSAVVFSDFAENPKKDIPFATFASFGIQNLFYIFIIIVYVGVLPVAKVAGQPLGVVAKEIMPTPLYLAFMIGGPIMALMTTLNASFTIWMKPFAAAAKDGWFPAKLGELNKNGQPKYLITIGYLWCVVPALLNVNLPDTLTNFLIVAFIFQIIVALSVARMPKVIKKEWEASHLHMPDKLFYTIVVLDIAGLLFVAGNMFRTVTTSNKIAIVVAVAISIAYTEIVYRSGKVKGSKDIEAV